MAEASNRKEILHQNLVDAGCSESVIRECMELAAQGKNDQLQRYLRQWRRELLDELHAGQKRIDCLDFLLYQIEKSKI